MIARNLANLAVADQVGPAIADIGDVQGIVMQQRRDASGAHAALAARIDLGVRALEGLLKRLRAIFASVAIIDRQNRFDRDLAGDLAGGVTTHAIADDQQFAHLLNGLALADAEVVFVMVARLADIATGALTQLHAYLPNNQVAC